MNLSRACVCAGEGVLKRHTAVARVRHMAVTTAIHNIAITDAVHESTSPRAIVHVISCRVASKCPAPVVLSRPVAMASAHAHAALAAATGARAASMTAMDHLKLFLVDDSCSVWFWKREQDHHEKQPHQAIVVPQLGVPILGRAILVSDP